MSEDPRSIYASSWRIDIVRRASVASPLALTKLARAVARALAAARAPQPGSVTVVLTDDDELSDLNREHLGVDGPTDVLSFPMLPPESFRRTGSGEAPLRRRRDAAAIGRRARTHIGDIAISVERATEQAEQGRGGHTGDVRWSPADEMQILVTHGALHLCGWDHAEPAEEAAMRALERELLAAAR